MLLSPHELELFFRLHRTLMFFVNQRLKVIPDKLATPEEFAALSPQVRLKVRDALNANLDLIQSFVDENPAHLSEDELDIVRSWRHLVAGKFYIFRELKKYTVFLSTETSHRLRRPGPVQPFEDDWPILPILVQAVLLPFKGMIVYDGLMTSYSISFGPGIRRNLNEDFKEAKARHGIVTSLPMSAKPLPPKVPKPGRSRNRRRREETDDVLKVIVGLIDQFCKEHLTKNMPFSAAADRETGP